MLACANGVKNFDFGYFILINRRGKPYRFFLPPNETFLHAYQIARAPKAPVTTAWGKTMKKLLLAGVSLTAIGLINARTAADASLRKAVDASTAAIPTRIIPVSILISAPTSLPASSTTTGSSGDMRPRRQIRKRLRAAATIGRHAADHAPDAVYRVALWRHDQPRRDADEFDRQSADGRARKYAVGQTLNDSHIQIYGWIDAGGNLSNNTVRGGNAPAAYDYNPNTVQLDQAVLYIERLPDTVQKDHVDWGFRVAPIYGENYRYTTAYGLFSSQLLNQNKNNGFDIPMAYGEVFIPQVAEGLMVRFGRFISIPDIEAQLAPNNYMYTHSMTYTFDNYTNTGIETTLAATKNWMFQLGYSVGTETMPWHVGAKISNPDPVTRSFRYTMPEGSGRDAKRHRRRSLDQRQRQRQHQYRCERHQWRPVGLQQPAMVWVDLLSQVQ